MDWSIFIWIEGEDEWKDCIGNDRGGNECCIKVVSKLYFWLVIFVKFLWLFECVRNFEVSVIDFIYCDLSIGLRGIKMVVSLVYFVSKVGEDDGNKCILEIFSFLNGEFVGVMVCKIFGGWYVRYKFWKLVYFG